MTPINDPSHDPHSTVVKAQKALIFVYEAGGDYFGLLLHGTDQIQEEIGGSGRIIEDHPNLEKHMPHRRGLHIWEGDLDCSKEALDNYTGPEYMGNFRSMKPQDFYDLDV